MPVPPETQDPTAVLGGRYRLLELVRDRPEASLWRGVDDLLDRPVAVKIVPLPAGATADLPQAIARAGEISDATFVRLLDVDVTDRQAVLVSEWIPAPSLATVLRDAPLDAAEAVAVVHEIARALAAAAAQDAYHGALHPDNVFVGLDGSVRVGDLETAATVRRSWGDDPAADDVRGLGALLYAALTARWPGAGAGGGLLPAPTEEGRPLPPRQIRPDLPREVDGVAARLLTPPRRGQVGRVDTAARAAEVLATLPRRPLGTEPEPPGPPAWHRYRPWAWRAAWLVSLSVIAFVGWHQGSRIGAVPGQHLTRNDRSSGAAAAEPSPSADASATPWPVASVHDFDPQGDGQEDPAHVADAVDGDPTTVWQTDHYQGNAHFGGLKQGVGLLLDLGSVREVSTVRIRLTTPGAAVEVHAGDSPRVDPATPALAGSDQAGQDLTLHVPTHHARYWLVWLTALPPDGRGGFAEGIAEISLLP